MRIPFRLVLSLALLLLLARAADAQPARATIRYAKGFTVEYHDGYKVVDVLTPWKGADNPFRYVLVRRGHPRPSGYDSAQFFTIPVRRFVSLSTTYLPHLKAIGALDRLVGVGTARFVNTPEVVRLIEEGKVRETGSDSRLNLETVIDLEADLVMTYAFGNAGHDAHPKLIEAGIPVAVNGEYMETSPLGRTEWMKFAALFFDLEAEAEAAFSKISTEYEKLAALGRAAQDKPTVVAGTSWQGTWHVAGSESYTGIFIRDAGGRYVWHDLDAPGAVPMDFEAVLDRAVDADYWINTSSWTTRSEALASDERYGLFAAFKSGNLYNYNARVNEAGGNDFWESGIANPHDVLADLLKIFHPRLVPDHEFVYYSKLTP